jgi:hypothetical protein
MIVIKKIKRSIIMIVLIIVQKYLQRKEQTHQIVLYVKRKSLKISIFIV